jgi:hypothetical protein
VKAREVARAEGLHFAYIGNVPGLADAGTTWCLGCKKPSIERDIYAITRLDVANGKCRFCGVKDRRRLELAVPSLLTACAERGRAAVPTR